ncbi:hypothetical protein CCOS865_00921 [Pseudomonas reidholzensis]|uniref:Uncharacterized protein n=1 Tax=Pseudomonas reidholzensis TaxID=1785162 RepID=A0A383RNT9_9PSED|nr:hypothetical protein [Pseudomonas reidholzensis]SYX88682.1 hypothetical protein CCOS865_00921 [Pseudomonas reidholzensis]
MPNYLKFQYVSLEKPTLPIHDDLQNTFLEYAVQDPTLRVELQVLPMSARYRVIRFLHAVDQAQASSHFDPAHTTLKLMVAPEFFFRDDTTLDSYQDVTLVTQIYATLLRALSTPQYKDWLFIPGSVFWHSLINGVPHYFNTTLIINGGGHQVAPGQGRTAQGIRVVGAGVTTQKALMSRIDYAVGLDKTAQDGALNELFKPIIGDLEWRRDHVFSPYGKSDSQGNPLLVGVETCLEHVQSTQGAQIGLIKDVERELQSLGQHLPPLHFQVVSSCGMRLNPASLHIRPNNAYALLCDGAGGGTTGCTTVLYGAVNPIQYNTEPLPPLAVKTLKAPGLVPLNLPATFNTELKIYKPEPL